MNARALLIFLLMTVLLGFSQRFRRLGVALSAVVVVLIIWQSLSSVATFSTLPSKPVQVSETKRVITLRVDSLQLNNMKLVGSGAPWHLLGKLINTSDKTVSEVKIRVGRYSCNSVDQATSMCKVLWQGEYTLRSKLIAGASESIDVDLWSHSPVVPQAGAVRDTFEVVSAVSYVDSERP